MHVYMSGDNITGFNPDQANKLQKFLNGCLLFVIRGFFRHHFVLDQNGADDDTGIKVAGKIEVEHRGVRKGVRRGSGTF